MRSTKAVTVINLRCSNYPTVLTGSSDGWLICEASNNSAHQTRHVDPVLVQCWTSVAVTVYAEFVNFTSP